jgi:hypothetical protein
MTRLPISRLRRVGVPDESLRQGTCDIFRQVSDTSASAVTSILESRDRASGERETAGDMASRSSAPNEPTGLIGRCRSQFRYSRTSVGTTSR